MPDSIDVALRIEKGIGQKVYILGDTTCGSCCVDEIAAQHVKADGIIHFGHACLNPTTRLPVLHILPKNQFNATELCNEFKRVFSDRTRKILFFYDVEYAHKIGKCLKYYYKKNERMIVINKIYITCVIITEHIYNILKPIYKHLVLSKLNCTSNVEYTDIKTSPASIVLGRHYTLENGYNIQDYEGFFLGEEGKTFALLAMGIPVKRWYCFTNNKINEFDALNTPWLKRRRFLIEKLKDAQLVGILVATFSIKEYLTAINTVRKTLKQMNKKSYVISTGKITPAKLANFLEVYQIASCDKI